MFGHPGADVFHKFQGSGAGGLHGANRQTNGAAGGRLQFFDGESLAVSGQQQLRDNADTKAVTYHGQNGVVVLGGKFDRCEEFMLPESDIFRNLVVIKKVKETPKKYPRKAGLPTKEPIS